MSHNAQNHTQQSGTLYLIPTPLHGTNLKQVLLPNAQEIVRGLNYFAVENAKTARAFLKTIGTLTPLQALHITTLNQSDQEQYPILLKTLKDKNDVGLLSEAGCPGVADPGAALVNLAHQQNIKIVPLIGPSSILLALMASGLNGQHFAFHGYLPVQQRARVETLINLENESRKENKTQIFIETPYRNIHLFQSIIEHCQSNTLLCVATNLTAPTEIIRTLPINAWKQSVPNINKEPTVFLINASSARVT